MTIPSAKMSCYRFNMAEQRVRQFRVQSHARGEAFLSYCVWDRESSEAVFVDPHKSLIQEYVDFASQLKLKPTRCVETQTQAPETSALQALIGQFRVPGVEGPIRLGASDLTILPTPGVQEDSICLKGHGFVLTGQTLWIGASSAFTMPGGDADTLWKSLALLRKTLAPNDLVFPGYDVRELCFSTWKTELEKNSDLLARDSSILRRLKQDPELHTHQGNLNTSDHTNISVEKFSQKRAYNQELILLDIREPEEFREGHPAGAENMPLSELAFQLERLRKSKRIYLCCQTGRRSPLAASTLSYVGMNDVLVLTGGFQAWLNAGLPVEK